MLRNYLPAFGGLKLDARPKHAGAGMGEDYGVNEPASACHLCCAMADIEGGLVNIAAEDVLASV